MERNRYTRLTRQPLVFLLGFGLVTALSGCEVYLNHDSCYGYPEIAHDIPNIELVAHAEMFVRELDRRPRVFTHSGGSHMYFEAWTSDKRVAKVWIDDYGVLTVEARRPGRARITVGASDDCDAYVEMSFRVRVVEPGYEASE